MFSIGVAELVMLLLLKYETDTSTNLVSVWGIRTSAKFCCVTAENPVCQTALRETVLCLNIINPIGTMTATTDSNKKMLLSPT